MTKCVLISISPEWCGKIASGQKTIEVRKTKPHLLLPFKVYIYCTKGKYDLFYNESKLSAEEYIKTGDIINGKIIGEFICDRIDVIEVSSEAHNKYAEESCLTQDDFIEYCNGQDIYGWHISDLVTYDKPKELREFKGRTLVWRGNNHIHTYESIKRPPQSWCYVEELK
ncbi:MAG: hypothetical protein J6S67_25655 [Methanobrevibacter sp.]|nr:hypothetical protein [Methanobrevibacter sp.]